MKDEAPLTRSKTMTAPDTLTPAQRNHLPESVADLVEEQRAAGRTVLVDRLGDGVLRVGDRRFYLGFELKPSPHHRGWSAREVDGRAQLWKPTRKALVESLKELISARLSGFTG